MSEVISNADTLSFINSHFGNRFGLIRDDIITKYLQSANQGKASLSVEKDIFIRSCAGYSLALYVLGVGDRHTGNIMVSKQGNIFHYSVKHCLGNNTNKFV